MQPALFETEPDPATLARNTDPATSVAAAAEIAPHVSRLERWAADCVRQTPGKTQAELGALYCPTDPRRIGRRLSGAERKRLVRRGPVRRCTMTGRQGETWYPVEGQ